jgi:hypothetical protein
MPESNLADDTRDTIAAAAKPEEGIAYGLPALQQLWDDMFTPLLKLCRDALGDDVAVATAADLAGVLRAEAG